MMGIRQQKYFCNKDVSFFSQLRLPGFCSQQISILQVLNYHPIGHILQNLLVNQLLMAFSMGVRIIVSFSFFAERDSACQPTSPFTPMASRQTRSDPAVGHDGQLYGRQEPWRKRLENLGGGVFMVKGTCDITEFLLKWLVIFKNTQVKRSFFKIFGHQFRWWIGGGLCGSHFEIYSGSTEKELPLDHCQFTALPFGLEVKPLQVKPPLTWDWLGSHNDFLLGPSNLCSSSLTIRTFSQLNGQYISVPALDTPVSWI